MYVPGRPALWIDPTNSDTEVGELPAEEQGRLALIAGPDTTGLVRTPETSAGAENRRVQTREFYLTECGPARVVETTQWWGAPAYGLRALAVIEANELKKRLADYANREYVSKEIIKVIPPALGFALPTRMVLEMAKAQRGATFALDAAVFVRLESVFSELPDYFDTEDGDGKTQPRKRELLLPEAFSNEIRYRIIPPPGYVARELPRGGSRNIGTATFSQEYRSEPDGTVTAILRFDSGPRLMPAAAADALRTAGRRASS